MAIHLPSPKGLMTSTVLTLLLCGVHNAGATPILDQSFEPPNTNLLLGMGPGNSGAQTFTVGITGTLARVDVFVERNGFADLHFDVRPTINGLPIEDDNS